MGISRDTHKPVNLYLNLTDGCNSACVFCVSGSQNVTQRRDISAVDVLQAYDNLSLREGDEVILNGGEPTTYRDLLLLIKQASARKARVYLCTNGRLLSRPNYVRQLLRAGVTRLSIPIHGYLAATHDKLTGRRGSLSQTLRGIRNAYELRASTEQSTIIELKLLTLRSTLPEWMSIIDFVVQEFGKPDVLVLSGLNMWSTATPTYAPVVPDLSALRQHLNETISRVVYHDINVVLWSIPLCLLKQSYQHKFALSSCQTSGGTTDDTQVIYFDPDHPTGIELPSNEFDPKQVESVECQGCDLLNVCGPGSVFMQQLRTTVLGN